MAKQSASNRVRLESVETLRPYDRNARTHSAAQVQQIANSIIEFGFTNPILVDEDRRILAGHGRLAAAQSIGMDEVPVLTIAGLTDAQKRAYTLADNVLAENADWNFSLMQSELEAISADFDLDLLGMEDHLHKFDPMLAPSTSMMEVTEENVGKAQDGLDSQFQKSKEMLKLFCPDCGHEYFVNKADLL